MIKTDSKDNYKRFLFEINCYFALYSSKNTEKSFMVSTNILSSTTVENFDNNENFFLEHQISMLVCFLKAGSHDWMAAENLF